MPLSQLPAQLSAWLTDLTAALDRRSAPRLLRLLLGALLARGRRTVTSWFRAAGITDDFRHAYSALWAAGRRFFGTFRRVRARFDRLSRPLFRPHESARNPPQKRPFAQQDSRFWPTTLPLWASPPRHRVDAPLSRRHRGSPLVTTSGHTQPFLLEKGHQADLAVRGRPWQEKALFYLNTSIHLHRKWQIMAGFVMF
jgi:hypothetical protein